MTVDLARLSSRQEDVQLATSSTQELVIDLLDPSTRRLIHATTVVPVPAGQRLVTVAISDIVPGQWLLSILLRDLTAASPTPTATPTATSSPNAGLPFDSARTEVPVEIFAGQVTLASVNLANPGPTILPGTLQPLGTPLFLGGLPPQPSTVTPDGRFLIVPLQNPVQPNLSEVAVLSLDPVNGTLSETQPRLPENNPDGSAVDPSGQFVFIGHGNPTPGMPVNTYSLTNGVLAGPVSNTPGGNNGLFGEVVTIGANTFLYFSGSDLPNVAAYLVQAGGVLAAVAGSPFAVPNPAIAPEVVRVDPTGRFLFASDGSVFSINQANGALSLVPGSPFTGLGRGGLDVSPNGQFLYNNNGLTSQLTTHSIAANGALTLVSALSDTTGFGDVLAERSGRFLYAVNVSQNTILGYSVASGAPSQLLTSPYQTGFTTVGGQNAIQLLEHPTLPVIYAINAATSQVAAFSIAP